MADGAPPSPNPMDAAGHRARLRQKLLQSGGGALADYEIIEYLLALAIPRRDTKPLAKALLREFGSMGGLINAEPEALSAMKGMGETSVAAIKIVQAAMQRMLAGEISGKKALGSWQALLDYLRADMAFSLNERVRVLHLDTQNRLIRDEIMAEGTIDQAAIHPREIIRRALAIGSAAIIIVHNHPSGDPSPSKQDILMTRELAESAKRLGISLHDHVIIGREGHSSLKSLGLF